MRVLFAFWKRLCYNVRRIHMAYERGERLWMPSIPITPPFSCMLTNTGFLRTGGIPAQRFLTRWFAMLFPGERSSLWGIHRMMSGRTMSFTFRREVYCPAQPRGNRVYQYPVCRLCPTGRHRYAVRFVECSVPAQFFRYAGNVDLLWESLRQRTD